MKHLTSIALLLFVMLVVGVSSFSAGKSKGKKPIVIQSMPAAKLVGNSTTPGQDGLQKSDQKKNNEKVIMSFKPEITCSRFTVEMRIDSTQSAQRTGLHWPKNSPQPS